MPILKLHLDQASDILNSGMNEMEKVLTCDLMERMTHNTAEEPVTGQFI